MKKCKPRKYIVVAGSLFEGVEFYGPFDTDEEAMEFADGIHDRQFDCIPLSDPKDCAPWNE